MRIARFGIGKHVVLTVFVKIEIFNNKKNKTKIFINNHNINVKYIYSI